MLEASFCSRDVEPASVNYGIPRVKGSNYVITWVSVSSLHVVILYTDALAPKSGEKGRQNY